MITRKILVAHAASDSEFAHCFSIREAVFIAEQGIAPEIERDVFDASAVHLLAICEGQPVGTARAVVDLERGTAKIGRVAVLKPARGSGVGAALLRAFLDQAALQSISRFELHAQVHAIAFYERLGYAVYGQPFQEAGMPHAAMVLRR
jgi:ElaA protein